MAGRAVVATSPRRIERLSPAPTRAVRALAVRAVVRGPLVVRDDLEADGGSAPSALVAPAAVAAAVLSATASRGPERAPSLGCALLDALPFPLLMSASRLAPTLPATTESIPARCELTLTCSAISAARSVATA